MANDKKKILIFPAGTEIAFELYDALRYSKFVELYGGTSVKCHAEFVFENCIENFPFINDPNFIPYLNDIIEKYNIDYVYPAHDSVLLTLTQHRAEIKAEIVASDTKTIEICRSKKKTYSFFKDEDFIPHIFEDSDQITEFPIFAKPDIGQGSSGATLINRKEELDILKAKDTAYVYMEYLPGDEYTIDCFTDKYGKLRAIKMRTRERIKSGTAVRSRLIPLPNEVKTVAERINSHLSFNGAWFFQLKKDQNEKYKLLEVAPRIPGTMRVSRNLGINFPLLTLYNMWGYDVDIIDNQSEILMDRAFISRFKTNVKYSKIYVDLDDTLIIDEKVNIKLIAFLYQAENRGVKLILLTKHKGDILEYLKQKKIANCLFDEIIYVGEGKEKSDYVLCTDAIFIDDSFAERKKIKAAKNLPVFDLDMVESLIYGEV